ncbi:MAG: hypothetical protein A3C43_05595 [Candidatus Schekmanbacteria bacterium RIFCSPHIGHO2_02_FULL_38_11]|uniref:histidine kinase n=1 Tax=Candidatus Schekmanbacteria bacterium RIFCSPLOWO2_12_FULL_38_15 TaxID=1817883 RepID=A0A1F7SM61_9BACT|nr:MAG: hypothetical protein A2043_01270 [Candidatus Schekmanbacteria bacterium GWA2_38_9]OGL51015.1 MAG: hypothetical protein A3H37_11100 [Candidatus Schekmanbacteria bacterium RIFCSPLOWO2_02_FULL_38_14]OGL53863.1 MAG: hypothetical protein A3C43_05595 [Candidatus Schekmanbacteria bacterium RIFCSPHIGHO2_02_FULL_38_11]OGL54856.1 MAG: hypothetical protein A3G31_01910 [Candidatus Schekmanbacteria bacterium RIFCSPLOWO2_12_FULL_38_15]
MKRGLKEIRWSLKRRYIAYTTTLIIVLMIVVGYVEKNQEERLLIDKAEQNGITLVEALGVSCTNTLLYQELGLIEEGGLLDNYILQIMKNKKLHVVYAMILDKDNRIIAHNDYKKYGRIYNDSVSLKATSAKKTLKQYYYDPIKKIKILDVATPLAISTKKWGTLRVGFSMEFMKPFLIKLYIEIILVALGFIFVSVIITWVLAKRLTEPISKLSDAMDKISSDLSHPEIEIKNRDEIGLLGEKFNKMIDRLRQAKKDLEKAQSQIIQSEKLASIGRLAAGVAHEINNPLDGIKDCFQMILKEPDNREQTSKYIKLIMDGLKRIELIVRELLDFSKDRTYEMEEVDVNEIAESSLSLVNYRIEKKKIVFKKEFCKEITKVFGNKYQLQQVLINLIMNSLDAVDGSGVVKVSTERENGFVNIKVSDNGSGISKNNLNKIFDPFFTTKEQGKGTGLGLSVSLGIVEKHKGKIEAESKEGVGSTFKVSLPLIR